MARKFLYVIAGLIMLTLAAAFGWNIFQDQLMRMAFVPSVGFSEPPPSSAPDYTKGSGWLARPGMRDNPTAYLPAGVKPARQRPVAVFYVPPTTYLKRDRWNAPVEDGSANYRLRLFAASQASAFTGIGDIWAPRYRQATMGAFLTGGANADRAIDFAYRDVAQAFDAFLAEIGPDRPILLAGHSQGSLHLTRLMHDKIAGTATAQRIVAAYLVGWPVSIEADLPAMGLPGCTGPGQAGCILSWQSYAEPAEPRLVTEYLDRSTGFTGKPRRGTQLLCVNPLSGAPGTAALASANIGALVPKRGLKEADLIPGRVPARCDPRGFLLIGSDPAGYDSYVLPGHNFHVFDYMLFWANIRADAAARTRSFLAR